MKAKEMNNSRLVDLVKYFAALMVICVHVGPLINSDILNFIIQHVIFRLSVPFFFISSAYFVRRAQKNKPNYLKYYLKKTFKSYLIWSLIFLPLGINWVSENYELTLNMAPLALLYGLIHVGTFYHLWYIPALMFALFIVNKLLKVCSYKILFIGASFLFLFGCLETYYGILQEGWFKSFFDTIINIFYTTRGGLLYGIIFVLIGFYTYDYQIKLKALLKYLPQLLIITTILLALETYLSYHITSLDHNFMIMFVPLSFLLFSFIISNQYRPKFITKKIRLHSKYYYFVHPILIFIVELFISSSRDESTLFNVLKFVAVVLLTHSLSTFLIYLENNLLTIERRQSYLELGKATYLNTCLFIQVKAKNIYTNLAIIYRKYLTIWNVLKHRNEFLNNT